MATLKELIERVEKATGADRDLDLDIARTIAPNVLVKRQDPDTDEVSDFTYWTYTASVDAVIGLIEEKTNWQWKLLGGGPDDAHAIIEGGHGSTWIELAAVDAPTPALAILLAFLRAMEARGDG